jgi:uncharacterized protein (UPF0248 family)
MDTTFEKVEKEFVKELVFPEEDVLTSQELKKSRSKELDRALALGNLEHSKIKIYFEDSTSKKVVDTTVWGVTDNRVILKQGNVIPIHRIYKVE